MSKEIGKTDEVAVKPAPVSVPVATRGTRQRDGGYRCYIGPNIKGVIQHGTIRRGTREDILASLGSALIAFPEIGTLLVSGEKLPEARLKIKTPGNALYEAYRALQEKGRVNRNGE